MRCEAIVQRLDPARIVYHHSSGNLSAMYSLNFYPNFVPIQELDDWFEHWATAGVKPLMLVEYGAPFGWDWTMYRGWYNGGREFGNAAVPWEYCLAEWNAQFLGDAAYQNQRPRKSATCAGKRSNSAQGRAWFRWDYPYPVGDARLDEMQPVQAAYTTDNWRAFRTWGLSANSPWEHDRFWKLRDGFQHRRENLPVDWDHLQQPGFSPDFIDKHLRQLRSSLTSATTGFPRPPPRPCSATTCRCWAGSRGSRNTSPSRTTPSIPAKPSRSSSLSSIIPARLSPADATWSANLTPPAGETNPFTVPTGDQARIPVQIKLPPGAPPGEYQITANFTFGDGESQQDSFNFQVIPPSPPPLPASKIALFDPPGQTAKLLTGLGVSCQSITADADLSAFDVLLIGKAALTVNGPAPDLKRVRDGLKVVVFEQTADVLEKRLGFRVEEYGLRQVWPRVPDSPLLAGLASENLRDWRGSSTLLPPTMAYTLSQKYNGAPAVTWCGLEVTRLWRCGNWGNVASVLIEKPPRGDFLPIVDGGYALQYSPLLEYREGRGLVLFCQLDVTARTETEPAAETIVENILRYVDHWRPAPRRAALYAGDPAGLEWLAACGIEAAPFKDQPPADNQALVVGPGGGRELAAQSQAIAAWLQAGGRVLALGLDEAEANSFLPVKVTMRSAEHIAAFFPPFSADSPLAGVAPADVHNRDPRNLPLVTGGATPFGDGVLAVAGHVVFCQLPPFQVSKTMRAVNSPANHGPEPFNLRRTFVRTSFAVSRLLGNCGVSGRTPLLERFGDPAGGASGPSVIGKGQPDPTPGRWLDGLYLTKPTEWDDPYRFFGW